MNACSKLITSSLCELDNCDGCPLQAPHEAESAEDRARRYHALLTKIWFAITPMTAIPDDIRDELREAVRDGTH